MSEHRTQGGFSRKHGPDATVDAGLKEAVARAARNGQLPCAVAFSVAKARGCAPEEVGRATDLLDLRLTKCQLGLFGYEPNPKIVKAKEPLPALGEAIKKVSPDGHITCVAVWGIADRFNVGKRTVSGACEAMGIRIKSCQIGAF